jgi:hypothetical protein
MTLAFNELDLGTDHARKKDELWGIFRGLEADFQKYVQSLKPFASQLC